MKIEIVEIMTGAEERRLRAHGFIEQDGYLYRRLGAGSVKKVLTYARNCMDLNPEKGCLSALREGCEFYNYDCASSQIDEISGFIA